MNTFLLNVSLLNRNFGDAIAIQGFSWIHVWNFVQCSPYPNQNSGAIPVHLISIHISTVICTLSQKNKTLSLFQNLKKITVPLSKAFVFSILLFKDYVNCKGAQHKEIFPNCNYRSGLLLPAWFFCKIPLVNSIFVCKSSHTLVSIEINDDKLQFTAQKNSNTYVYCVSCCKVALVV